MRYRLLGRSGISVSVLSLGTVFYGSQVPAADAVPIIHAALDRGVNFVDTAEIYTRPEYGAAEKVLGQALGSRRHDVVLATKKRYDPAQFRTGTPADHGLSRRHIVAAIEGSLRRLRSDYVDLYYPHHVDPDVDLEETLRAFDDLLRAGKVRAIGLSNYPAWLTVEALWIADCRSFAPVVCVQTLYNLLDRSLERELGPACAQHGVALVPYSPLAGGVLTAKYGAQAAPAALSRNRAAVVGHARDGRPSHIPLLNERTLAAADRLAAVAGDIGLTPSQAALAWTVHQPGVASVIMGASSVAQLEENLAAADVALDGEAQRRLEAAVDGMVPPPAPGAGSPL